MTEDARDVFRVGIDAGDGKKLNVEPVAGSGLRRKTVGDVGQDTPPCCFCFCFCFCFCLTFALWTGDGRHQAGGFVCQTLARRLEPSQKNRRLGFQGEDQVAQ